MNELLFHLVNIRAIAIAKWVDENRGFDDKDLELAVMEINAEMKILCDNAEIKWEAFIKARDAMYAHDASDTASCRGGVLGRDVE